MKTLAIVEQLSNYDALTARRDVTAGLTTAIMLIPQAMAYAMIAGLPPITGLYASTIPLAAYAVLGSSRQLAVGPVAMVSLLVASSVGAIASPGTGDYVILAALLALMVGVIQVGMGAARLGFLVDYLAHPVVAGFSSAAALIIGFSQLKHLVGVDIPRSHHVHTILLTAARRAGEIDPTTFAIGLASVVSLLVLKRFAPRLPRFLVVVTTATLVVWGFDLNAGGVAIVGAVPDGLPPFSVPDFDGERLRALFPMALTIAIVAFMESISVAKSFARRQGHEVDADRELIGLGSANLLAGVFAGYPVTGGFSRTAVNAQAGARTTVASLVTAGVIAITLLWLTPLFYFLPKSVLAAIIMTAVFGLIDIREARHLWAVSRPDLALMGITFAATLSLGIEAGIGVGVLASIAAFLRRMSRPHVAVLGRLPDSTVYRKLSRNPTAEQTDGVLALRFDAPLFFANAVFLKKTLRELETETPVGRVVLDAAAISGLDASALGVLNELVDDYKARGVELWIAGVRGPVHDVMERDGLVKRIGTSRFVHRVHDAVSAPLIDADAAEVEDSDVASSPSVA